MGIKNRKEGVKAGFEVRTVLALEEKESFKGDDGGLSGVALKEWNHPEEEVKIPQVRILNKKGPWPMGKPGGT